MKKILSLFLCLVILGSFVACGGDNTSTDSMTGSDTNGGTNTDSGSTNTSSQSGTVGDNPETAVVFDETMEHKFLATDITSHGLVVYDLNLCDGDYSKLTDDSCIVWEWDPEEDINCKKRSNIGIGIDAAKYRYSAYYEKDVIVACSSAGWAGVIDYEAKTVLWEANIGRGPHEVEMLPNGDVVVACSSDPGALVYVPLSAGVKTEVSSIPSLYCHGVNWDPENECLWVLEDRGVYAAVIQNMGTKNGKIVRVKGSEVYFANAEAGGHAFSPVYGEPGFYWAASGGRLWKYNAAEGTITKSYNRSGTLTKAAIKGVAYFADGTMVQSIAQICGNSTQEWSSDGLRIITREWSAGKLKVAKDIVTVVKFEPSHREFYKVHPFNKNYQ